MKNNSMDRPVPGTGEILTRSLGVGIIYAIANMLMAALLGSISRQAASWENALVWILGGTMISLSFSPILLRLPWSRGRKVLILWIVLALIGPIGLGIEGFLFKPVPPIHAVINGIVGIIIRLLVAYLIVWLLAPLQPAPLQLKAANNEATPKGGWLNLAWCFIVASLSYFVFYFFFGGINYLLYTKAFYENNPAFGLSRPSAEIVFLAELIRGPLMVLGVIPIVRALRITQRQIAGLIGILLFVVGGLEPYIEVTFRKMPLGFNLATLTEILFQNFLTGVVVAHLFGPKRANAGL